MILAQYMKMHIALQYFIVYPFHFAIPFVS